MGKILPQVNMDNLASAHKRSLVGTYDKDVFFTYVKLSNSIKHPIFFLKREEEKNIRDRKIM